jgi:DNA-binding response OmpR family regulator
LRCGSITLDRSNGTALVDGRSIHLTRREEDVLVFLMHHAGEAVRREKIFEAVWGESHTGESKILDVYIRGLRRKLERDPDNPALLVTLRGRGFRLAVDPS